MAFDGITVAAITKELSDKLTGARLYKIAQPESDELLLTIKPEKGQLRLLLSADPSLPLVYITDDNKPSPMSAPNFCMLLRKHILNGRIISITQPSLERIIRFEIEHMDELGDLRRKTLVVELMGKYSNIIFIDEKDMIIDSIKHINALTSSVREVLPGREYFVPNTTGKLDPFKISQDEFIDALQSKPFPVSKAMNTAFTGISSVISEEVCYRAGIDSSMNAESIADSELCKLYSCFFKLMTDVKNGEFRPCIVYEDGIPKEFAGVELKEYSVYDNSEKVSEDGSNSGSNSRDRNSGINLSDRDGIHVEYSDSMSDVLYNYYSKKASVTRIRQKSSDLRRVVTTLLERNVKKYDIQLKQLKDTEKKDKFKVFGELITAFGYGLEPGTKSFEADNYYTGEKITIPLDDSLSPIDNAKKYFDKYQKLKRTEEAVRVQIDETEKEINHLESIKTSLDIAVLEADLTQIKEEMIESGYIKRKGSSKKKEKITSKPFHYISSDGFHMYVGKNNFQNEELTFKVANGGDYWFHAKKIPGSHVIVKTEGKELPDRAYEEAAALAAFYSKGREQEKVEVDYVIRKEVKKPAGSPPGFVVYYTNYSMNIRPDISGLSQID